jgi:hypothetical protein
MTAKLGGRAHHGRASGAAALGALLLVVTPLQAQVQCEPTTVVDTVIVQLIGGPGVASGRMFTASFADAVEAAGVERLNDHRWVVALPTPTALDELALERINARPVRQVTVTAERTGPGDAAGCRGLVFARDEGGLTRAIEVVGDTAALAGGQGRPNPVIPPFFPWPHPYTGVDTVRMVTGDGVDSVFVSVRMPELDSTLVSDTVYAGYLVEQVLWWLEQTREVGDSVAVVYVTERLGPAVHIDQMPAPRPDSLRLRVGLQGGFMALRAGGKTFSGAVLALVLRHRLKWHFTLMGGGRPSASGDIQPGVGRSQSLLAGNVTYYPTDDFWGVSAGLAAAWENLRDFDAWIERAYGITVGPRLRTLDKWHVVLGLDLSVSTYNRFLGARDPSTGRAEGTKTTFPSFGFSPSLSLAVTF